MNEVGIVITAQNQASPAVATASQDAQGLASSVKTVGEVAGGILAANTIQGLGKAVGGFAAQAVSAGDEIFATAQKMGVSTDALQEMRFWADQNGVSHQALERAVATLNQRVGEAAAGEQIYADAFANLGVELTDSTGKIRSTELVMRDTIAALLEMESPAERAGAAVDIFGGRMARELLPALNDGSLSLEEATQRAHELGIVMDSEAVAASDAFADSLSALQQTGAAVVRDFVMPLVQFLGDHVLPVLTDVAAGFRELPGPVSAVASAVGVLSVGVLLLAPRVLAARSALIAFGVSARVANLALGAIGVALIAVTAAMGAFGDGESDSASSVEQLTASLDKQTGAITDQTREILANKLEREGLLQQAEQIGVSSSDLVAAILGEEDAWNRVVTAIDNAKTNFVGVDGAIALNRDGLEQLRGQVESAQGSWERQSEAVQGATEANIDHLESLQAVADELRAQTDPAFAYMRSLEKLADAQSAVTEAEEAHGKNSPEYRRALRDEAEAALDVLAAAGALGDEFTGELSDAQEQMLRDAGISEEAIEQLAADLRRTKDDADRLDGTRVRINVDQEAERRLRNIRLGIDNIPRNVNVNVNYSQSGALPGTGGRPNVGFAHGGVVGAAASGGPRGNRVLVGELGPEIVDLAPGSMVHPAGASASMLAGGGAPIVFHIHPSGNAAMDALFRWMVEQLSHAVRTQAGGDPVVFFGGS